MPNPFDVGTRLAAGVSFAFGALAALAACEGPHRSGEQSRMTLPGAEAQGRKAGLWEQKVSDGQTSQVTRLCLDGAAQVEEKVQAPSSARFSPCLEHWVLFRSSPR